MAGLQCCCRKLIFNTSRLVNKNGILLQPSRRRHHLLILISSPKVQTAFTKSRTLFNHDRHSIYRFASTNLNTPKEPTSNVPNTETVIPKSEASELKKESEIVESSTSNIVIDETSLPEAPITEVVVAPVLEFVSTGLKEPSFQSLGLCSYWPSGWMQSFLEFLHINLEMPWWQAIMAVTFMIRLVILPMTIKVRKETIHMTNHLPEIAKFQKEITDAKTSGDVYRAATLSQEMQTFIKEKNINLTSFLKTAVLQGPIFLSMFYGLKGMVNAPVESLKTEGLFWFEDLTVPDPYYILPVILSTTLFCVIEFGAEGNPAKANTHSIKWIMRGIPVFIFFVSTRFPTCITLYWTISNLLVLGQVSLLKIPALSKFLKIPQRIAHAPVSSTSPKKGFIEGFKEGFENAKLTGKLQDLERTNLVNFQKAGTSAIPRTFKKNPLLEKAKK